MDQKTGQNDGDGARYDYTTHSQRNLTFWKNNEIYITLSFYWENDGDGARYDYNTTYSQRYVEPFGRTIKFV